MKYLNKVLKDSENRKYFLVGDNFSLFYSLTSSGLKENVLTCNCIQKIDLYINIIYIAQTLWAPDGGKLKVLMLCTCARIYLFYFIVFYVVLFYS